MALAYGNFDELSHQLRFLLFEAGIGLSSSTVDYFIAIAHRKSLYRLQQAALLEGLINQPIHSHHIQDFITQLRIKLKQYLPESQFFHWQSLSYEMKESIANEALALAFREHWQRQLKRDNHSCENFWKGLTETKSQAELLLFLEQWGCTGHPTHPNFRAKIGFSRREVLQYSPEFRARVSIHWCALKKSSAHTTDVPFNYQSILAEQYPKEFEAWRKHLAFKQFNPDEYYPVPVHPWQWRNQLISQCATLIDSKTLILLPHHQSLYPSMSFRTMMPEPSHKACHIKLATNIHATSAKRTVSPASVHNGPRLSQWINQLLGNKNHYEQTLFIARDFTGLRINDASIAEHGQRQLSVLLRQHPVHLLNEQQQAVPLAALLTASLNHTSLLIDIIQASGLHPLDYFRNYCDIVLSGQLHFMLSHGIAFEAHQQNTLLIFSHHRPKGLILRDLGNIRVCQQAMFDHPNKPELHPESTITTQNMDEVRHKFIHGNLESNIIYWIHALHQHYHISVTKLWKEVRGIVEKALTRIRKDVHPALFNEQSYKLLNEPWQHKCLLSMRLNPIQADYVYYPLPNPLADS
ncbi:IucA/IucC family protein [Legionella israelensis]|uniref:FrgA protein n=1 Tax=Legionella israelensis TaxID=454 RepID=A0A0W0V4G8_9GAMM|nr:IucA/IucC family protein [Legionella israelensis]KTD15031.1 FrgA protein [Legionella israelensis]QBS09977.1 IucA/IucC family siderophore biosynthesis protein [Legionella israelensis]SCX77589.1 Siderophore synthetase component [Legionella israelensis DSM 19235]STX59551.1 siderophore biosynthetic protein, iron repressed FrgA [Legionella israelensis]